MQRYELILTIRVRSPFLFPGQSPLSFGLDAAAARTSDGKAMIPAEQIRGVFRHALGDVIATGIEDGVQIRDEMFGTGTGEARKTSPTPDVNDFEPSRGRLIFSDCVATEDHDTSTSIRVAIDPETGAAARGA
ncbi:RAMP superfamily CRISPR-associated protein [Palleronia caenipelagi]|uniref:CRISPR type III-associated protein domain-containing protein n=1 Tax=Palleronia caenipelagi TaxID=2489174 RepID=A0A547PKY8_9RHOB|nr:RAMP superfamily CRISPR-associated protein [Palleronia caenipelagi]TRD14808.1 hypothetical protein FEV53_18335 [Palleronia caenipelagi]